MDAAHKQRLDYLVGKGKLDENEEIELQGLRDYRAQVEGTGVAMPSEPGGTGEIPVIDVPKEPEVLPNDEEPKTPLKKK